MHLKRVLYGHWCRQQRSSIFYSPPSKILCPKLTEQFVVYYFLRGLDPHSLMKYLFVSDSQCGYLSWIEFAHDLYYLAWSR